MVSARNLIVLFALCRWLPSAAFAQDTKVALRLLHSGCRHPGRFRHLDPPLTPERRGDILMARKMYREAIEAYATGAAGFRRRVEQDGHRLSPDAAA